MSKQVNMIAGASVQGGPGVGLMTQAGNPWTVADAVADDLVERRLATPVGWSEDPVPPLPSGTTSTFVVNASAQVAPTSGPIQAGVLTLNADVSVLLPSSTTTQYSRFTPTLVQDAVGGRSITWPGNISWANGTQPLGPVVPNDWATFDFVSGDFGANWRGARLTTPIAPTVLDRFTRANSTSVLGAASDFGGAWTAHTGTWGILGNAAYMSAQLGDSVATIDTGKANHDASVTVTFGASGLAPALVFRATNDQNYWLVLPSAPAASPQTISLWKRIAGAYTLFQTVNLPAGTLVVGQGTTIRGVANGTTLTVYVNGTLYITATAQTDQQAATRVGLRSNDAGTTSTWDNLLVI